MVVPNSFNAIKSGSGAFTRRWGSSAIDAVDPYITGYFFIRFTNFPDLIPILNQMYSDNPYSSGIDMKNALQSSCTSVTIPGGTVNKTDMYGLGGIKYGYPTNVEFDNTISLRFNEWQGAPIYRIISAWVKLIRDYRSGSATATTKSDFAASMYYWTTAPDGKSIATAFLFTGIFPMRDPADQFGHDLTANDKLETDIDFNADVMWQEKSISDRCQRYANEYYNTYGGVHNTSSIVNTYGDADSGSVL